MWLRLESSLRGNHEGNLILFVDTGITSEDDISQRCEEMQMDIFYVESEATSQDLAGTLRQLNAELTGERLLGALMFSCGARGPHEGMVNEVDKE